MSVSAVDVVRGLDDVALIFGFLPFGFVNTGGGCMAFQAEAYSSCGYVLVTGEDNLRSGDVSDFGSGVTVGVYDDETGECVGDTEPVFVPFVSDDVSVSAIVASVCVALSALGVSAVNV